MRKQPKSETIAESLNGDWIEVSYDRRGNPDFYMIYFATNGVTIMVCPEEFKAIKELFWSLNKDLETQEYEEY